MNPVQRITATSNGTHQRPMEAIKRQAAHVQENVSHQIEERPLTIVWAAFSFGLIAGAGAVALYCQATRQPSHDPESMARRIAEAVRNAIPQSLQHFRS